MPVRVLATLIAALVCAAVPAQAPATSRTVLVETFGSVSCPQCGDSRAALSTLEPALAVDWLAVEYHVSGPLATSTSAARSTYYGTPTLPAAVFDGTDLTVGGAATDVYETLIQTHATSPAPLEFDAVAVFTESSRAGSLNVEIRIDDGAVVDQPEQYILRAVIVEDMVQECCGPGGETSWNRVVRGSFPERSLRVGISGEIQFEQYVFEPFDLDWEVTNLSAIVWLQRDSDRTILAATLAQNGGGLQPLPLDNLDESKVNMLPAWPNPLRSGRVTIIFTLPEPDHASVHIVNGRGRIVRVLTDGPRPSGIHDIYWDGNDYAGRPMATGVYLYRLETSAGVQAKKLVLLR